MNRAWDHFHQKDTPSAQVVEKAKVVKEKTVLRRLITTAAPPIPQTWVAVITAAVVAALGEEASEYRVASISKVEPVCMPGNIWSQAGRLERINSRQRFFERAGK